MHKNRLVKTVLVLIILICLGAYPVYMLINITSMDYHAHYDTSNGINVLDEYSERSLDEAQNSIDNLYKARQAALDAANLKKNIETSIQKIDNGELTYREVFKDVYVAGDSLVAGLSAFEIINPNHLMARVSANLSDLQKNLERIKSEKPRILILHYGINGISPNEDVAQKFINWYSQLIQQIQNDSPNTRIIISLIFPVDNSIAKDKRFEYIDHYNELLKQMCKDKNIEYLDSTTLVKNCKQYYKDDGIHFVKGFYVTHWAKHIMSEMEIY